jgi:hypothetical protein
MKEPENCSINYCGFKNPKDFDEIEFEILGLSNLIKKAEEKISSLRQSSYLVRLAVEKNLDKISDLFEK